ncbi:MAG: restriction endonuclease [Chloroflexi bacterium]|nr:restriction endonuclease [Chloroflexota bacterium]OJW06462.1 MAG: restriction endonuclease [Chloroflexi bacterium 54-19]
MAIPDYQSCMLPLLVCVSDRKDHKLSDIIDVVADYCHLTQEERNEFYPNGKKRIFYDRLNWAATYLKKALLLGSNGRGLVHITERGIGLLNENPTKVNVPVLRRYPEFLQFEIASNQGSQTTQIEPKPKPDNVITGAKETPREILERSYQTLRSELAAELIERVKSCSSKFFEQLVVDLLVAMGYGGSQKDAGQAVGQSGDGGIDGIIKEDKLGLDAVYIQAKRWENTVGRPTVQAFAGSLEGNRARKGVLITTSQFSQDAKDYVNRIEKRIVLIDGNQLGQYMIDYNVGVNEIETYVVKKIDQDYFGDG